MPEEYGDVLEIIPENEIENFCRIVAQELPTTVNIHEYIKTSVEWRKKDSTYDVVFYRNREDLQSGIFVSIIGSCHVTLGLYIYARKGYENTLKEVLLKTKKIPWHEQILVSGILPRHTEIIESVIVAKRFIPKLYADTTLHFLDRKIALTYNIRCPPDVYPAKLTSNDIEFIYKHWPHTDIYTKDAIRYAVDSLSFGIFSKANNELLSWVMYTYYGAIGMLYTTEKARRNGYAKILLKLMCKELSILGIQPYAVIVEGNSKSISLFHSIGFEQSSSTKYIIVCKE